MLAHVAVTAVLVGLADFATHTLMACVVLRMPSDSVSLVYVCPWPVTPVVGSVGLDANVPMTHAISSESAGGVARFVSVVYVSAAPVLATLPQKFRDRAMSGFCYASNS